LCGKNWQMLSVIIHKFLHWCIGIGHWLSSNNTISHQSPCRLLQPPVLHPLVLSSRHLPQHLIPYYVAELDKSHISKSSKRYKVSQVHRDPNQHRRRIDGRLKKIERMNGVKRKNANSWKRGVPRQLLASQWRNGKKVKRPYRLLESASPGECQWSMPIQMSNAPNPPSSTSATTLSRPSPRHDRILHSRDSRGRNRPGNHGRRPVHTNSHIAVDSDGQVIVRAYSTSLWGRLGIHNHICYNRRYWCHWPYRLYWYYVYRHHQHIYRYAQLISAPSHEQQWSNEL
jgi:hypothetical protein